MNKARKSNRVKTGTLRMMVLVVLCALLFGCVSSPPQQPDNICAIFLEKPKWYKAAKRSANKWGGPIYLPMAIMYQESSFRGKARPAMKYFFRSDPNRAGE